MTRAERMVYGQLPHLLQDACVTVFNRIYAKRMGGWYKERRAIHEAVFGMTEQSWQAFQLEELNRLLEYAWRESRFYRQWWGRTAAPRVADLEGLAALPVLGKDEVKQHLLEIATIGKGEGYEGHTGGTTGKSMEVRFSWRDVQDRQAALDMFRGLHGWQLGKRTAWFSGKQILTDRDVKARRFWKTDWHRRIRYYSTFHLAAGNLQHYIDDLNRFQPEYLSGFSSSVHEIAQFSQNRGGLLKCRPQAFFSTAETLIEDQAKRIEEQFNTAVRDQYSSSEGAPFVIMCPEGRYHFLPSTGILEIVDEQGNPAPEGEVVVTSFATYGTPLIRYRIGDRMAWDEDPTPCACGSSTPRIFRIEGRVIDAVWSEERGRINLGNISNCVKDTPGVLKFQVIQRKTNEVNVWLVVNHGVHDESERMRLEREFVARLGRKMRFRFDYCDEIPVEPSGKYRIVKNFLTPEQMIRPGGK